MSGRADSATWPAQARRPGGAADELRLADGTRLGVRAIGRGDRDGLAAMFARLSPESRHRRFLSPKPELTARELTYLTDIDHVRHEAFAAVRWRDGVIVGVARYAHHAGAPGAADFAVEVIDELQGMGIGTALAARTVRSARERVRPAHRDHVVGESARASSAAPPGVPRAVQPGRRDRARAPARPVGRLADPTHHVEAELQVHRSNP
jgi:ribosomal protein S18 acetylase RimI-like enzyme